MSRRSYVLMRSLRTYISTVTGLPQFSAPIPGWPSNDTLRPESRTGLLSPRKDKGSAYEYDRRGTRRVAA